MTHLVGGCFLLWNSFVFVITCLGQDRVDLQAAPNTSAGFATSHQTAIDPEVRDLVAAFNNGDLSDPRWQRWRQLIGPVRLMKLSPGPGGHPVAWLRGEVSRGWIGVQIRLDSVTHRLNRSTAPVLWTGGGPPAAMLDQRAALRMNAATVDSLRAYFAAMSREDIFSGVVLVGRGKQIIFEGAFGAANQSTGLPNTMATRFAIASVGKVFTAAAIMRLVQEGKLSLSDTVGAYLSDYPVPEARHARIDQLLTHTAGLGGASLDWIALRKEYSLADLIRVALPRPLEGGSGRPRYNNEAFLIAGRIVEIVTGERYESYVKRTILDRAGMQATGWDSIDEDVAGRAIPYSNLQLLPEGGQQFVSGPRRDVTYMHGFRGTPAGGAISTAGDLSRFGEALLSNKLLDDTYTRQLLTVQVQTPVGQAYAYGFEAAEREPSRVGKGGNAQGTSAQIDLYPSLDLRVVVMSNYDSAAQVAAQGIREILGLSDLR